jgi:hypothetical protein
LERSIKQKTEKLNGCKQIPEDPGVLRYLRENIIHLSLKNK